MDESLTYSLSDKHPLPSLRAVLTILTFPYFYGTVGGVLNAYLHYYVVWYTHFTNEVSSFEFIQREI